MMKTLCKLALALVLVAAGHADPVTDPRENDPAVARMLSILNERLEPAQRDRVLELWSETRDRPADRAKLIEELEKFEKKMQPDWTGLAIGGGTVALASGIGAGVLAAKLGAAGMVAGPIGAVAGLATGALVGYAIHQYHQRKATSGYLPNVRRRLGGTGGGLEGALTKLERELAKPAPAASPAPAAPKKHWYDRFRRPRPAAIPAANPAANPAPANPAAAALPATNPRSAAPQLDDPMDDVNVSLR